MNKIKHSLYLVFLFMFCCNQSIFSQTPSNKWSVSLAAEVDKQAKSIKLVWLHEANADSFLIYRKHKTASSWGTPISTLPANSTEYLDINIALGVSYEYKIKAEQPTSPDGYGYINSGIELAPVEFRGSMALVVDNTYINLLDTAIQQLKLDMVGDGWNVFTIPVNRNDLVVDVKEKIVALYDSISDLSTVFLLGNVPVPYSGRIVPDGHSNNHLGAWPADGYYGDMDGIWNDTLVDVSVGPVRIHNVPGDGKFDPNYFPSDIELQVGRVDLTNLPAFPDNDITLLNNYLQKAHQFKHYQFVPQSRGVVDDHFTGFSEGFAGNGFRNFPALTGLNHVITADYFSSLNSGSFLWSYGCGGGNYGGANGIGSTTTFANSSPQGVFTILFGSYFGDWDNSNNFLRAPLASGSILTNCWAGRPHWYFLHMGMGEPIGYSTKISMNNHSGKYNPAGSSNRGIHMGLMGDPTLRLNYVKPVDSLQIITSNSKAELTWSFNADSSTLGFFVYRADSLLGPYTRIDSLPANTVSYSDNNLPNGVFHYMVRKLKLEETPSGTYVNLSQGVFSKVEIHDSGPFPVNPTNNSGAFLGQATIDNVIPPNGSWIAAFDPYGNVAGAEILLFAGGVAHINLPIYEDDPSTGLDEGMGAGDTYFTLKLYDALEQTYLDYPNSQTIFQFTGWQSTNGTPIPGYSFTDVYNFESCEQDIIPLNAGWNLISFDVITRDSTVQNMFSSLIPSNLQYVTSFDNGSLLYDPLFPPIFNTLQNVTRGFGYWVKVQVADTLVVCGTPIPPGYKKDLDINWSLVGYPPAPCAPVATYFNNLITTNNLIYVTGFDQGSVLFDPDIPPIFNTLTDVCNGFGYWVKTNAAVSSGSWLTQNPNGQNDLTELTAYHENPSFMFVHGTSNLESEYLGKRIQVYSSNGINCGEIEVLNDGMLMTAPIYGDDPLTPNLEGPLNGDSLSFQINGIDLKGNVVFGADMIPRHIKLELDKLSTITNITTPIKLTVSPNPFTTLVNVTYEISERMRVQFAITDVLGKVVSPLLDEEQNTGIYNLVWKPENLPSGIYFLEIRVNNQNIKTKKLIHLK